MGAFSRFVSKNEAVCCDVQTDFGSFLPASFAENVLGTISRFVRPKTKLFAAKFRDILEVLHLQDLQKNFRVHFHDFCVQKWSCLLLSSDAFWKFSPYELYAKSFGRIFINFGSKNEAVCREVQTHFRISPRARFTKNFWAHFHDLCFQKRSCWLLSLNAFLKFSTCKVCRKSSGCILMICVSRKQTSCLQHFLKRLWARFTILRALKSLLCCSDTL